MNYRTILVHCDATPKLSQRLEVAVELAQRFGALLAGVHVQVPIDIPTLATGVIPPVEFYAAYEAAAKAQHDAAAAAFEKAIKGSHLSAEWRLAKGYHEDELVIQARYADLFILGQTEPTGGTPTPRGLPEMLSISSGRATLVVPHIGVRVKPGKSIMLCWNASREGARAAADALPFLTMADKVTVLIVNTKELGSGHGPEPGAAISAWLARHGVRVTVLHDVATDATVGEVILSHATDHDVDLIVMGLYGHSRLREVILGGASRTVLSSMTVPVLMAH
jgi:nucleotide-binding universal stress UspA family protein